MVEQDARELQTLPDPQTVGLTARQLSCVQLAGAGLSSKEIGRDLGISPSTVDNHIQAAVTKLNARNRWHAAQLLDLEPVHNGEVSGRGVWLLPPLGGSRNYFASQARLFQMLIIAKLAVIVVSALIILGLGAVHVFGAL